MGTTGWLGEAPDEAPAPGFAGFILAQRPEPDEGRTLEQVFARVSRPDRPPEPYDDDDRMAAMVTRGYRPGLASQLALQLGDVEGQLAAEREKIEAAAQRAKSIHRMHAAGRIDAFDVMRMLGEHDEGDEGRVRQLEHRAESLRRQIAEANKAISPPQQRDPGPEQAAMSRAQAAHREYVEASRAAWEAAQRGTARRARRPFGSVSRGGVVARSESCQHCIDQGVPDDVSYLLHSDPELNVPVTPPAAQAQADRLKAEADRLMALGYTPETARYAAGAA